MRSLLIALLLVAPLQAQTLDIGRELPVADAKLQPAFGTQSAPATATDGNGFFAAWLDARNGTTVRGARISAAGEVLDPAGILLSEKTAGAPEVLWTGSEYVVSWLAGDALKMTRVRPDGTVVERERTLVTGTYSAVLATNGRNLLAASLTFGPVLHLRLFTLTGEPTGAESTLPWLGTVRAAGSAAGFLILGVDPRSNVIGQRVSNAGQPIDNLFSVGSTTSLAGPLFIASDGTSFVTAWPTFPTGSDLRITTITSNAVTSTLLPGENPIAPRIVWSGSAYELFWSKGSAARHARLGSSLDLQTIEDVDTMPAAIAATPTKTLLVFQRGSDLFFRFLGSAAETALTSSLLPQQGVVGAWNGSELLLAWLTPNEDGQGARVFFSRMLPDGTRLDGAGIQLTEFASPQVPSPAVATDGDSFLIAWPQADGKIATQRIGPDGSLREQALIENGQGCRPSTVSLAWDGSRYVLAYSICRSGLHAGAAGTIDISRVGIPIGSDPLVISVVTGNHPRVVWTGRHRFVTWLDSFGDRFSPPPNVVGAIANTAVEHAFFIATSEPAKSDVTVATNGETVFVAWQEPLGVFYRIYNPFGDVLAGGDDGSPGILLGLGVAHPSAAWDGSAYVVAWEQGANIAATRISTSGAILGSPVIFAGSRPSVIAAGTQVAIAYTRDEDVSRAFVRFAGAPRRARTVRR
ncbi:MAG TPA: hypothetical protein VJ276_19895 [Thermoanaerobaculia bacterium]|nr:hypothetical protein [Thermoanaerobaculia bacterium]